MFGAILTAVVKTAFLAAVIAHFVLQPLLPVLVLVCLSVLVTVLGIVLSLDNILVGYIAPFHRKSPLNFALTLLLSLVAVWAFLAQHQEIHAKSPYVTMLVQEERERRAAFVYVPKGQPSKMREAADTALEGIANLTEWSPASFQYDVEAMGGKARLVPWNYPIEAESRGADGSTASFACSNGEDSHWRCFTRMFVAQVADVGNVKRGTPVSTTEDPLPMLAQKAYTALPLPQDAFDVHIGDHAEDGDCATVHGFRVFLDVDGKTMRKDVHSEALFGNKHGDLSSHIGAAALAELPAFLQDLSVNEDAECTHGQVLLGEPSTNTANVLGGVNFKSMDVDPRSGRILHEVLVLPANDLPSSGALVVDVENRDYFDLTLGVLNLNKDLFNRDDKHLDEDAMMLYVISSLPMAISFFMLLAVFPRSSENWNKSGGATQSGLATWMLFVLIPVTFMAYVGGYRLTLLAYFAVVLMAVTTGKPVVMLLFALLAGGLAGLNVYIVAGVIMTKYEIALEHSFALSTILQYDPFLSWTVWNQDPQFTLLTLPLNLALCALITVVSLFRISMIIAGLAGGRYDFEDEE